MIIDISAILGYAFIGNTVQEYIQALCIFLILFGLLYLFKKFVITKLRKAAQKTKTDYDDLVVDIIAGLGWPVYTYVSVYVAVHFLSISDNVLRVFHYGLAGIIALYIITSILIVINFAKRKIIERKRENDTEVDPTIINVLAGIIKALVWIGAFLLLLQNLGYNVTSILAGLGVLGIAVAFALQNILADIFASFSIYFDKPFVVGDTITVGTDTGTVQKIGIKSTRIKTLAGNELVISNKELTTVRVNNYKGMETRRIVQSVGIAYDTPLEKLREIPGILTSIISPIQDVVLDRVHLAKMADSSLNYEIVYIVQTGDYKRYMDIQQEINLAILEEFGSRKIVIAYPTQTIYVNKAL